MQKAGKLTAEGASEMEGSGKDLINAYEFQMMTAADQIMPSMIKGDLDIALLPSMPRACCTPNPRAPCAASISTRWACCRW